jgi:hypothetical protein
MIPELLEFMGVILILATSVLTHGNPYFIGLAYTTALLIAKESQTHFNPLFVLFEYMMNRKSLFNTLKLILIQLSALMLFLIAYKF